MDTSNAVRKHTLIYLRVNISYFPVQLKAVHLGHAVVEEQKVAPYELRL